MTRPEKTEKLRRHLEDNLDLSPDEAEALIGFKGDSKLINEKIRQGRLESADYIFCESLESAVGKLDSTQQPIIYRNFRFSVSQLSEVKRFFTVGQKVRFREFQSCTIKECFAGNEAYFNCKMIIKTLPKSQAKDIYTLWDKFDLNDAEKEVVFARNCCFEICEIQHGKLRIDIMVKEISDDLTIPYVPEF